MQSMPITQSMAPSWCVRCVIILFIPHQESATACEVLCSVLKEQLIVAPP